MLSSNGDILATLYTFRSNKIDIGKLLRVNRAEIFVEQNLLCLLIKSSQPNSLFFPHVGWLLGVAGNIHLEWDLRSCSCLDNIIQFPWETESWRLFSSFKGSQRLIWDTGHSNGCLTPLYYTVHKTYIYIFFK